MKIKFLDPRATMPTRGTEFSCGFDLYAIEKKIIPPCHRELLRTGIAAEIPSGFYGKIQPRSGLAYKYGIDVMAGVIDSDYRGELKALLINLSAHNFSVFPGDRIAQLVIMPYFVTDIEVVEKLDESDRGSGGFGSTGK